MIKEILNKGKTRAMETKYNTQYMTIHIIIYNIQRYPIILFLNEKNTNDQKMKFIEKLMKWPVNMKKILNLTTSQENINFKKLNIYFWPPDQHKLKRL